MNKAVKLSLVAFALSTIVFEVHALTYRFKFKATSSGSDMYACNAGILTQKLNRYICYRKDDRKKIPVDRDVECDKTDKVCHSRLLCISPDTNGGAHIQNKMTLKYSEWVDHDKARPARYRKVRVTGRPNVNYEAFHQNIAFDREISDLLFELNTEAFNAKYFVDICYRGPQNNNYRDGIRDSYVVKNQVGSTDFLSKGETRGDNDRSGLQMLPYSARGRYTQVSGLEVQSFTVCDTQGYGVYKYGTNSSGEYNTSENEAKFLLGADGMTPTGASGAHFFASALAPIPGVGRDLLNARVTNPRFCKVRYVFTETNAFSELPNPRSWERKGAEICTHTTFNDPVAESN